MAECDRLQPGQPVAATGAAAEGGEVYFSSAVVSSPVGLLVPDRFGRPSERHVEIAAGDKLVLFTDGLLDLGRDGHPIREPGADR